MGEILYHEVLTDTDMNKGTGDWHIDESSVEGTHGSWSISQKVMHGGKQEGSKILTVNNGAMIMELIPTRGMGIKSVTAGDVRLGWDSPIKEVVNPAFIDLTSRGGLGWLEGFNEWMCRCGIEFSGHPTTQLVKDAPTNILSLHGKIANIPSSYVDIQIVKELDTVRLVVRSRVDERVFHGPQIELWSEVSTEIGSTRFRVQDTVTNRARAAQEYQMLYHCNFGTPLLEEGARLVAPVKTNEPFNDWAKQGLATHDVYGAPEDGRAEQVYKITLRGDAQNNSGVLLHNKDANRGASMRFSLDQLPYFTQWTNTEALTDGYVTGLEPGTCFPHRKEIEQAEGRIKSLEPGGVRAFQLDVAIHLDSSSVSEQKAEIENIGK